jgi:hypothetical protein
MDITQLVQRAARSVPQVSAIYAARSEGRVDGFFSKA